MIRIVKGSIKIRKVGLAKFRQSLYNGNVAEGFGTWDFPCVLPKQRAAGLAQLAERRIRNA